MAYQRIDVVTHDTIPQLIVDFAEQQAGWLSAGPGAVRAPGSDQNVHFKIERRIGTTAYPNGITGRLISNGVELFSASSSAPYVKHIAQAPTKMHLFGGLTPEPYVAAVVEYSPGFYRHFYIGYVEKLGDYTGGEVMCGSLFEPYYTTTYDNDKHQYLFGGIQNAFSATNCGGVRLVHADLGGQLGAAFLASISRDTFTTLIPNRTLGGFRGNINDQQLARGQVTYAGVQVLVPVNLYLTRVENRLSPIGRPAGVRMVNMANLDPAAPVNVGGKNWRCFPQFKKGGTGSVGGGSPTSTYINDESSYLVGYAYLED